MPLPPALAARLAKRGLISSKQESQQKTAQHDEEEVIAENYDAPSATDDNNDEFGNPLPSNWEKVFNAEHGTWYYWDTVTNKVMPKVGVAKVEAVSILTFVSHF